MKRFLFLSIFFSLLLLFPEYSICETILWEDENGSVLLDENGEVTFISPDGSNLGSVSSVINNSESGFQPLTEVSSLNGYAYSGENSGTSSDSEGAVWMLPEDDIDENNLPELLPVPSTGSETSIQYLADLYSTKLQYGDTGNQVSALQSRLAELGFYDAKVTGGYYKITTSAVKAFQSYNGLSVDGVAGPQTLEKLFSADAVPASATPLPSPTPVPTKYLLAVDITNQITRAYTYDSEGNYTVLVREMICSTGTTKNPTPLGTTIMPKSRARWGYFPTWKSHAQYLTRIDSANAFHSVLYTQANEQALAVSSFEKLGTRQSHGCVRLTVSDAKWIYENCQEGTIIVVYESEFYDPEYTMTLKPTLNQSTLRENPLPEATAIPAYVPENWPKSYRMLKRGSVGADVYMVQMRLWELGYYKGSITGGYYEGTMAAVKAFQKDHGLSVDGIAGEKTQAVLFATSTPVPVLVTPVPEVSVLLTPEPTPVPTATPEPASTPEPEFLSPVSDTVG